MKTRRHLFIIGLLSTVLTLGVSVSINQRKQPTEVEATQYTGNYNPYTYTGHYYDSITTFNDESAYGMNGDLRESLTNLILPKEWFSYYGSGSGALSDVLQKADEDPTNSNNMVYLYTRDSVTKNAATGWNREHVWPQSLSGDMTGHKNWGTDYAGADLLHIRPTYENTNSSRSNDKYCDVNKTEPRVFNNMTFGYGSGEQFEPLDAVKGDVARIVMYIWTAYTGFPQYSYSFDVTRVFESYDTLLKWHTQDKPDVLEGNRNDYCETTKQKNRNPFVDHPELAWKIFGEGNNQVSSSVLNACKSTYPSGGSGTTNEGGTLSFSVADYYTDNSLSNGDKVTHITPNNVVTIDATASSSSGNTGKMYKGTSYTEWRFYASDSGALEISVADGYELVSAKGQIGSANYGDPNEVNFAISNNKVEYNPGTNFNVKSLEITYVPIIEEVELTGISLNKTELTLTVGEEQTLVASPIPNDAELESVTWLSSDGNVANVDQTGKVEAIGAGTATITAKVSDDIKAECEVTVNEPEPPLEYIKVAGYNFSSDNTSNTTEHTAANLLDRFNDNDEAGDGLSDIVTGISGVSKVYKGYANYYTFGLKLGTSSDNGSFTLSLNRSVNRVIVYAAGWGTSDNLKVGDATAQTPGVAYSGSNPIKELTFDITASNSVQFVFAKRGFIKAIEFYCEKEENTDKPINHLSNASTIATVNGSESMSQTPVTDSITFKNAGLNNAQTISTLYFGQVEIECSKGTGKTNPAYYSSGEAIRFYSKNTLTLRAPSTMTSIVLNLDSVSGLVASVGTLNTSNNTWTGSANEVTFTNSNDSGQIRITSISATCSEKLNVDSVSLRFGVKIPEADWTTIKNTWGITDYGVMLIKTSASNEQSSNTFVQNLLSGSNPPLVYNKRRNGATYSDPIIVDGYYTFTVKINITDTTNVRYSTIFYAAPFICVDGTYIFLNEKHGSVNSLAAAALTSGDSDLSNAALKYLSTAI